MWMLCAVVCFVRENFRRRISGIRGGLGCRPEINWPVSFGRCKSTKRVFSLSKNERKQMSQRVRRAVVGLREVGFSRSVSFASPMDAGWQLFLLLFTTSMMISTKPRQTTLCLFFSFGNSPGHCVVFMFVFSSGLFFIDLAPISDFQRFD